LAAVANHSIWGAELAVSGSARRCIIKELPFDYEGRIAWNKGSERIIFLYEREVDIKGMGAEVEMDIESLNFSINKNQLNTHFSWYSRETKEMNYQSFQVGYPFEDEDEDLKMQAGLSINTNYWQDPRVLFSASAYYKNVMTLILETNFTDRNITVVQYEKRYPIGDGTFYIGPLARYQTANGETDWWAKLTCGVYLHKIWGKKTAWGNKKWGK
ncbi:hypothetical protein LCGC14_2585080, partial [marine sediment metagenome]